MNVFLTNKIKEKATKTYVKLFVYFRYTYNSLFRRNGIVFLNFVEKKSKKSKIKKKKRIKKKFDNAAFKKTK